MATLADVVRKRRSSGQSRTQSLMGSLKEKFLEKIDPRQILNQSGILSALFPSLKAFKAEGKINQDSSKLMNKTVELVSASISTNINNLNEVAFNTELIAKNSLVLPVISRDMNLMRQNIAKLVKAFGITPTQKADAYFKKSGEREREYESKFKVLQTKKKTEGVEQIDKSKDGILSFLGKIISPFLKIFSGLLSIVSTGIKTLFNMLLTPLLMVMTKTLDKVFGLLTNFMGKALKSLLGVFKLANFGSILSSFLTSGGGVGIVLAALAASGYVLNELRVRNTKNFERAAELHEKIKNNTASPDEKLEYGKLLTEYKGVESTLDPSKAGTNKKTSKTKQEMDLQTANFIVGAFYEPTKKEDIPAATEELERFGVSLAAVKIYRDNLLKKSKDRDMNLGSLQNIQNRVENEGMLPPDMMDPLGSSSDTVTQSKAEPSPTPQSQADAQDMENGLSQQPTQIQSVQNTSEVVSSPIIGDQLDPAGNIPGSNFTNEGNIEGNVSLNIKNVESGKNLDQNFRDIVQAKKEKVDRVEKPIVIQSDNNNQSSSTPNIQSVDVYDKEFLKFFLSTEK